ncbi:MAG: FHA domain-containing protein [Clostridia bacterium]|nr:FHA domain-containing protein [Clostridia bacterium]
MSPDFMFDLLQESGAVAAIAGVSGIILTIVIILGVALLAVWYFFTGYLWQCIGRKAGLRNDWMPYVPVAYDIYRLRAVKAPIWHLFFFGFTGSLCVAIVSLLLGFITPILSAIVAVAWAVLNLIVTFLFYRNYYKAFGFNPLMALIVFVPAFFAFAPVIDMLIAFKGDIRYGAAKAAVPSVDLGGNTGAVPPAAPIPAAPVAGGASGQISALDGMYKGSVFTIADNEEVTFGRDSSECQIIFDQYSTDVSRKHCSVRYNAAAGSYTVIDYSKNGTFTLDGRRLQPNVHTTLSRGTIICIGSKKNTFRLG